MHRQQEMSQVTEDDVNEVKGDISTLRFELLDVFKNNGMDISSANKNSKGSYKNHHIIFMIKDVSFSQISMRILFVADYIFV